MGILKENKEDPYPLADQKKWIDDKYKRDGGAFIHSVKLGIIQSKSGLILESYTKEDLIQKLSDIYEICEYQPK